MFIERQLVDTARSDAGVFLLGGIHPDHEMPKTGWYV
jgi:hypothetical protein